MVVLRNVLTLALGLAYGVTWALGATWVPLAWALLGCGAVLWTIRHLRRKGPWHPGPHAIILGALLLGYVMLRVGLVLHQPLPMGWDPWFHLLLAAKVQSLNGLFDDWMPYESIGRNYPLGSHIMVAGFASLVGLNLLTTWGLLLVLWTAWLALEVHVLAQQLTQDATTALYAAVIFLFVPVMGSLGYALWGGLPSLIGLSLWVGALNVLLETSSSWGVMLRAGGALAVLCVVHHHGMLCAAWVLGALAATDAWWGHHARALRVVKAGGVGLVLASPYLVPYALRVGTLGTTGVTHYFEARLGFLDVITQLGPHFAVAAAAGLVLLKHAPNAPQRWLLVVVCALLLAFVALDDGARWWWLVTRGQDVALFTPSRFLSNTVPFLACAAGLAYQRVTQRFHVSLGAGVAVLVSLALVNLEDWAAQATAPGWAARIGAYTWVRENMEPDALVIDDEIQTAFFTRRAAAFTPIPSSEPAWRTMLPLAQLALAGRVPLAQAARQYVVVTSTADALAGQEVWRDEAAGLHVLLLHPAHD